MYRSPFVLLLRHRFASAGCGQSIGSLYPTVSGCLQQGRPHNHPLVNNDLKAWFKKYDPTLKAEEKPVHSNSFVRLAAVQRRVVPAGVISDMAIMEALRSKDDAQNPVCKVLDRLINQKMDEAGIVVGYFCAI